MLIEMVCPSIRLEFFVRIGKKHSFHRNRNKMKMVINRLKLNIKFCSILCNRDIIPEKKLISSRVMAHLVYK